MKTVKVIRYLDGDDYKYTVDDGEDFPTERDLSGTYVLATEAEAEIEKEKYASKFLEELIKILYGENWENLTIHEAKKFKSEAEAEIAALIAERDGWKKRCIEEGDKVNELTLEGQALHERQRVLVEALESMIVVCKEPQSYDFVIVAEIIRAALAAKEG